MNRPAHVCRLVVCGVGPPPGCCLDQAGLPYAHLVSMHCPTSAICSLALLQWELVDGMDLLDYLNSRGGVLAEAEAAPLFAQLVHGMRLIHETGLVHRGEMSMPRPLGMWLLGQPTQRCVVGVVSAPCNCPHQSSGPHVSPPHLPPQPLPLLLQT